MKADYLIIPTFLVLFLSSCETGLQAINYGEEQCASCKMIISDKRFGAELVTHKGKVYKYDATECLLRTIVDEGQEKFKHFGVSHFESPGELKDALSSFYLVSENLPSPMGGNLSAYVNKENALNFQSKYPGKIFSFEEILNQYRNDFGQ